MLCMHLFSQVCSHNLFNRKHNLERVKGNLWLRSCLGRKKTTYEPYEITFYMLTDASYLKPPYYSCFQLFLCFIYPSLA